MFWQGSAKKFLYDKKKALAELVIPDETKEENIADKKKKKSHRKNGIKNTKNLRAESEKCLKLHKIS